MPLSAVDVFGVPSEPVEHEEDVGAAGHSVTNPWSLLQQALLPHQLPAADARVQVLGLVVDQIGFSKQVRHAWAERSSVTDFPTHTHTHTHTLWKLLYAFCTM